MVEKESLLFLSVFALSLKTVPTLKRRFNGFLPQKKLYPLGPYALLGFRTSQALSPLRSARKASLFPAPLSSFVHKGLTAFIFANLKGFLPKQPGISLLRAPACLAFLADLPSLIFLEERIFADYFFISKFRASYEALNPSLCEKLPPA